MRWSSSRSCVRFARFMGLVAVALALVLARALLAGAPIVYVVPVHGRTAPEDGVG